MILQLAFICSLLVLLIISYQDFKYRAVTWFLYPILALLSFPFHFTYFRLYSLAPYLLNISINIIFISVQLLLLKLYFITKERPQSPMTNHKIGLGDILMFYAVATWFSFSYFIFFYLSTLILSVVIVLLIKFISGNTYLEKNIPLAGLMAVFLLIFILLDRQFTLNPLDDLPLLNFLNHNDQTSSVNRTFYHRLY